MLMVIGVAVVLAGVIIGWFTVAGSGIHKRPYGKQDAPGFEDDAGREAAGFAVADARLEPRHPDAPAPVVWAR